MKIISLKLCNFRQFYGKTPTIKLANGEQNTTVIHGNNGAGKTTLLNAFTWVLYEKFTAAFASPDLLINTRAIQEANIGTSVECHVEIYFEHEDKHYQLKRQCYACRDQNEKIQYNQSKLFLRVGKEDGRWICPSQQPEDVIGRILPESLHQYFFFDGERIDHFFRSDRKNNIAEDTKELLGVKVLDRSIDHLKVVKRKLQDELKAIGNSETKELLKEQKKLEQERDRLLEKQEEIIKKLALYTDLKQRINQQLLKLSGAKDLQKLKDKLEKQEKDIRKNLGTTKEDLKRLISSNGYTILTPKINTHFKAIVKNLREQGELPSGIKQRFVQNLLNQKRCICGTELLKQTPTYQEVSAWMNKAGMADVEEAAIRLEAGVGELEKQIPEFWQNVDRLQSQTDRDRRELARVENELDDLKQKLRTYPDDNIQDLQKRLDETEEMIRELTLEQGGNQQEGDRLEKEITVLEKQMSKQQLKEEKQTLAQRRISVTQDAIARLIEVRSRLEKQFRLSLEQRVQEIFSQISFTPYIPRLSPEYELTLMENTSGIALPVAASTGENQILSLAFISGIIDRVREWSQTTTLMGPDSSTFPIVMDSPFGSLDEIYRRQVARTIPKLANQLVVLVTKTQWRGEVATEIQNSIGREYVLLYHSPKSDCEEDAIAINNKNYPLVKQSSEPYEYTEIIEVTSA
ncbi:MULTISPECIES: AAA family ATPase [Spirulina sp. CCY15215]|uniref:AAA family ATPase n=1 Tax=Spirulina sp. CCY15215 TaxID=2767591 RepID=UPI00194EC45C|nr:AAA family ATPase [Spirulina major]